MVTSLCSDQMALPLLALVHCDEEPPDAFADWFGRGDTWATCRTCGQAQTRGQYWEIGGDDPSPRSEPMCSVCWQKITRTGLTLIGGAA